jgi:putative transposase
MRTGRPERLSTFDYVGRHRYFLTFCTIHRRRLFVAADAVALVLMQFERSAAEQGFAIAAYCFMPDHVHLLVEGVTATSNCRSFITKSKQMSGFHFRKTFGRPLWQQYFYERTLRTTDETLGVMRYIIENPLRAGLVERVADYPFAGSSICSVDGIVNAVQWHPPRSRLG